MASRASRRARTQLAPHGGTRAARTDSTAEIDDFIDIVAVEPREGHWLRLWFSDGAVKDVDLTGVMARGGVFAPIRDSRELFEQVRVNPRSGTIEWPGEVDLDPEVLYGLYEPASGVRITRVPVSS